MIVVWKMRNSFDRIGLNRERCCNQNNALLYFVFGKNGMMPLHDAVNSSALRGYDRVRCNQIWIAIISRFYFHVVKLSTIIFFCFGIISRVDPSIST